MIINLQLTNGCLTMSSLSSSTDIPKTFWLFVSGVPVGGFSSSAVIATAISLKFGDRVDLKGKNHG